MDGILPINKPTGITSYDVIRAFKKESGYDDKIGHAGTLDPFAGGALLLLLGKATKKFKEIQKWEKTYVAKAVLGKSSDTLDKTGKIVEQEKFEEPSLEKIEKVLPKYLGKIEQKVPAYSAAKSGGVPLYKLARRGKEIPEKKKLVEIKKLEIINYEFPYLTFSASVSSGTYIRQLAYDWLRELNIESYLEELTRIKIGKINLKTDCCEVESFASGDWKKFVKS